MLSSLKQSIDNFLTKRGRKVVRYPLLKYLTDFKINLVLDVGANVGQYGKELRFLGYKGEIISFEPQRQAYEVLSKVANKDGNWRAFRYGLGSVAQKTVLNISGNGPSSSILELENAAIAAAPALSYVDREEIDVKTLDEVFPALVPTASRVFLKIDTQGFERQVIEGASAVLDQIAGVQMELSLVSTYQGETLAESMIALMRGKGFVPFWMFQGYRNEKTLQLYQIDAVFFRG